MCQIEKKKCILNKKYGKYIGTMVMWEKTKIYNEMIYEILIKRYLWNYYGLCIKIFVKIKGF